MSYDDVSWQKLTELPERPVRRFVQPIIDFLEIEAVGGIVLIAATIVAVTLANSPWHEDAAAFWSMPIGVQIGANSIVLSLRSVINDGLMTLFFFVAGLEIKRAMVLGELRDPRVAALPIAAAIGGMIVPAALYLAFQFGKPGARDWGVVMATDIAFVVGCLALLGKSVPLRLRVFVLSLAIIDDVGAVLVIAVGYSSHIELMWLAAGAIVVGVVVAFRRVGVRSILAYYFIGGLAWFAVHESGLHATIVGIVLGLLTPAHPWIGLNRLQAMTRAFRQSLRDRTGSEPEEGAETQAGKLRSIAFAARETLSPLERLEIGLHPWVSFLVLPLFALANAGVPLSIAGLYDPVVGAVVVGLVLGKPLGILGASWLAIRLGLTVRPEGLSWAVIGAAGALCGIGFTMALFIANLAFDDTLLVSASLGILVASLISAVLGVALLALALRAKAREKPG